LGGAFLYVGTRGGNSSNGVGINDRGQVTGDSVTSSGENHAFLYDHGTMYDLNNLVTDLTSVGFVSLGEGFNINNDGQIVGDETTLNGDFRAFLATPDPPTPSVPLPLPSTAALLSLGLVILIMRRHGGSISKLQIRATNIS
jgi:probable HAF family extracellular repeat protein